MLIDSCDRMKLIDFGLSNFQAEGALLRTHVGSAVYAAPECIVQEEYDGVKIDIWSCGVVLFTMLCGNIPWVHTQSIQLIEEIKRCDFFIPTFVSPLAQSLIKEIIVVDPEKRLSVEQSLGHPWLRDVPDPPPLPEMEPVGSPPDTVPSHSAAGLAVIPGLLGGPGLRASQTKPDVRKLIALGKGRMKLNRGSSIVSPIVRPLCLAAAGSPLPLRPDRAANE
jgi:serine/threonine protein kinase